MSREQGIQPGGASSEASPRAEPPRLQPVPPPPRDFDDTDHLLTATLLDRPPDGMRFRYRTAVLLGPWRESRTQAQEDAVRARQAQRDDKAGLVWMVEGGRIELGELTGVEDLDSWNAH